MLIVHTDSLYNNQTELQIFTFGLISVKTSNNPILATFYVCQISFSVNGEFMQTLRHNYNPASLKTRESCLHTSNVSTCDRRSRLAQERWIPCTRIKHNCKYSSVRGEVRTKVTFTIIDNLFLGGGGGAQKQRRRNNDLVSWWRSPQRIVVATNISNTTGR